MRRLLVQAFKFFGISGTGWILDFLTYIGMGFISGNLFVNNAVSSWAGVTFAFIFATRKVFQNSGKTSLRKKYAVYLVYQCILIVVASKIVSGINVMMLDIVSIDFVLRFSAIISKILVTPFTMVLNFAVMKVLIEKL